MKRTVVPLRALGISIVGILLACGLCGYHGQDSMNNGLRALAGAFILVLSALSAAFCLIWTVITLLSHRDKN